jgi:hypothetical protein
MSVRTVVVGSSRAQKLPSLVLEYTILKRSSSKIKIVHTYDMTFPEPSKQELRSRTGFSFNRFAIPAIVGRQGVAAYLECDQIVFKDIDELFGIPFEGATVLRPKNQASVLLLDCPRLNWDVRKIVADLDAGVFGYRSLMEDICIEPKQNIRCFIPEEWNSLEKYIPGKTALLHYTDMNNQPWRRWWPHPLRGIWMNELREAIASGILPLAILQDEVSRGHVVSKVLEEVKIWKT